MWAGRAQRHRAVGAERRQQGAEEVRLLELRESLGPPIRGGRLVRQGGGESVDEGRHPVTRVGPGHSERRGVGLGASVGARRGQAASGGDEFGRVWPPVGADGDSGAKLLLNLPAVLSHLH